MLAKNEIAPPHGSLARIKLVHHCNSDYSFILIRAARYRVMSDEKSAYQGHLDRLCFCLFVFE